MWEPLEFCGPLPRTAGTHCPWEDTQGSRARCSSAPCRALGSALPAGPKGSRKGPYPAKHHPTSTASHEGWGHPGPHTGPGSDKGGAFPTVAECISRPDSFPGPLLGLERVTNNQRSHSMRGTPRLESTPPRTLDLRISSTLRNALWIRALYYQDSGREMEGLGLTAWTPGKPQHWSSLWACDLQGSFTCPVWIVFLVAAACQSAK